MIDETKVTTFDARNILCLYFNRLEFRFDLVNRGSVKETDSYK